MSADAVSSRELDAIRDEGEQFVAALNEEFYLHYAGLKVLCLSSGGCETVQSSAYAKLGTRSRTELARRLTGEAS